MCLPKNGMAMFTSETGQQALSLLQQLPGKVGCDVQRSRFVEAKIPDPNFSLTPLLTNRQWLWEGAFLITHRLEFDIFKGVTDVTVVGDNYSDYETMMTVINDQRLIPAIVDKGRYQHVF